MYADTVLPFGLRSAPKIITAVADAFHWAVLQAGMEYMFHYVDDFITIASTNKKCQEAMQTVHTVGIRTRSTDGAQEDGGSGTAGYVFWGGNRYGCNGGLVATGETGGASVFIREVVGAETLHQGGPGVADREAPT